MILYGSSKSFFMCILSSSTLILKKKTVIHTQVPLCNMQVTQVEQQGEMCQGEWERRE